MLLFLTLKKLFNVEILRLSLIKYQKQISPKYEKSPKICEKTVSMDFYSFCPEDLVTRTGQRKIPVRFRETLG